MFISQMEDSHLANTINLMLRKINEAKASLGTAINIDPASAAIYGINTKAISQRAKDSIRPMIRLLYPYLSEAALRGMDMKEALQDAFGREGKETRFVDSKMLPASFEDYDDDGWDDMDEHDFLND